MKKSCVVLILLVALVLVCCGGCLRRRLTIRSDPPGAVVYIDRRPEPIGVTPVSTSFTYYGTRQIQLVKDGYETLTIRQNFAPPWYEIPPLDFIVENLWPKEVRDERVVSVHLEPQRRIPADEVLARAEQLRQNTYQGIATPLRPATPTTSPTTAPPGSTPTPLPPPTSSTTSPPTPPSSPPSTNPPPSSPPVSSPPGNAGWPAVPPAGGSR